MINIFFMTLVTTLSLTAAAEESCSNLNGLYEGVCTTEINGSTIQNSIVIGFAQAGCTNFLYNDTTKPYRFYTTDQASLYESKNQVAEITYVRRAILADQGKTVILNETQFVNHKQDGIWTVSGNAVFNQLSEDIISYKSERIQISGNENKTNVNCPSLKRVAQAAR